MENDKKRNRRIIAIWILAASTLLFGGTSFYYYLGTDLPEKKDMSKKLDNCVEKLQKLKDQTEDCELEKADLIQASLNTLNNKDAISSIQNRLISMENVTPKEVNDLIDSLINFIEIQQVNYSILSKKVDEDQNLKVQIEGLESDLNSLRAQVSLFKSRVSLIKDEKITPMDLIQNSDEFDENFTTIAKSTIDFFEKVRQSNILNSEENRRLRRMLDKKDEELKIERSSRQNAEQEVENLNSELGNQRTVTKREKDRADKNEQEKGQEKADKEKAQEDLKQKDCQVLQKHIDLIQEDIGSFQRCKPDAERRFKEAINMARKAGNKCYWTVEKIKEQFPKCEEKTIKVKGGL